MFEVEDVEAEVEIEYSHGMEYFEWKCPTCGATTDVELNVED
jgi:acetone carboxylase gamma subunit